ncbi:hypothetical protein TNCV_2362891 [Trichonephila clavipes]|nr:hypothetical protein TNCV_2362891 [Trichonephila clavipes]
MDSRNVSMTFTRHGKRVLLLKGFISKKGGCVSAVFIVVSDADCCAVGPRFESGEDMGVCKCIVPGHGDTLSSRQAASPFSATASQLCAKLQTDIRPQVSRISVIGRLHKRGLLAERPTVCIQFTFVLRRICLTWYRKHRQRSVQESSTPSMSPNAA